MSTRRSKRGVILVLAAGAMVVSLAFIGLFVDIGIAFVTKARLAKAVDAGALAAARTTAKGTTAMRTLALQVANANYPLTGTGYVVTIDTQTIDTTRVKLAASTTIQTLFARALGPQTVSMSAFGEATRFPLDLSLLLDVSQSLDRNDAFVPMQQAAKAFVARFDPNIDQVGLVQFSTVATQLLQVKKAFSTTAPTLIDAMVPIADTNIEQGIAVAKAQLDAAPLRTNAVKVLVLFTDGRPTAFRDTFTLSKSPTHYDGVISAYINGSSVRGLFEPVGGLKILKFSSGVAVLAPNLSDQDSADLPTSLPGVMSVSGPNIRTAAMSQTEAAANVVRAAGYHIYCVGLGSLTTAIPEDIPDLDLLRRIANEGGVSSTSQPKGIVLYAPSPNVLLPAFSQLADRLLTRLTR